MSPLSRSSEQVAWHVARLPCPFSLTSGGVIQVRGAPRVWIQVEEIVVQSCSLWGEPAVSVWSPCRPCLEDGSELSLTLPAAPFTSCFLLLPGTYHYLSVHRYMCVYCLFHPCSVSLTKTEVVLFISQLYCLSC